MPRPLSPGLSAGSGLTWLLSRSARRGSSAALLLAGVAVTAFLTSIQTFIQQLNTDTIKQVYKLDARWLEHHRLAGRGGRAALHRALAGSVLCLFGRLLDVLAVGDEEAASLGVRPGRVRLVVLLAASLATAAAVAVSGLIGFVGIVVPHVVRLFRGSRATGSCCRWRSSAEPRS